MMGTNVLTFLFPIATVAGTGFANTVDLAGYLKHVRVDGPANGRFDIKITNPLGVVIFERNNRQVGAPSNELTDIPMRGFHVINITGANPNGTYSVYLALDSF